MIIAGVYLKTTFGIQGRLLLMEGSASDLLQLPESYSVRVETKDPHAVYYFPLNKEFGNEEMHFSLVDFHPNSNEKLSYWIHGDEGKIFGYPAFKAVKWEKGEKLPAGSPVALITNTPEEALKELLKQRIRLKVSETATGKNLASFALNDSAYSLKNLKIDTYLSIEPEVILQVKYEYKNRKGSIQIPLNGDLALINQTDSPHLGRAPITIDIETEPLLAIVQHEKIDLISLDRFGRIFFHKTPSTIPSSYIAYDEGFGGYAVSTSIPQYDYSREEQEKLWIDEVAAELESSFTRNEELSPPLQFFCKQCSPKQALKFLSDWNQKGGWLFPNGVETIPIDLQPLDSNLLAACHWVSHFFDALEDELVQGHSIQTLLKQRGWPLVNTLKGLNEEEALTLVTQQLFAASKQLPKIAAPVKITNARVLSAFFRAFGIHLSKIPFSSPKITSKLDLETPLGHLVTAAPPILKQEENIPKITLAAGKDKKTISLAYDRYGLGMKWPIDNLLLRFEPAVVEMPHRVRLHRAKQINYPNSDQAEGFESELTFTDQRNGLSTRKTISMNHVYETNDGYRFYLSGLSKNSAGIHTAQIIVNRDPGKTILTYPGGLLVALGICLLFWSKRLGFS